MPTCRAENQDLFICTEFTLRFLTKDQAERKLRVFERRQRLREAKFLRQKPVIGRVRAINSKIGTDILPWPKRSKSIPQWKCHISSDTPIRFESYDFRYIPLGFAISLPASCSIVLSAARELSQKGLKIIRHDPQEFLCAEQEIILLTKFLPNENNSELEIFPGQHVANLRVIPVVDVFWVHD